MKLRRINRAVHRDLGYFFFGMAIIYGLSGIALNHRHQWNPNYIITQQELQLSIPDRKPATELDQAEDANRSDALFFLGQLGLEGDYRTHITTNDGLRIFIRGGSLTVNSSNGEAHLETIRRRPVFHQVNFLHYNTPRKLWTWFSDLFAAGLIILAFTGLFILKGKNGITGRGAWLTGAGIVIPLVMLYIYLNG